LSCCVEGEWRRLRLASYDDDRADLGTWRAHLAQGLAKSETPRRLGIYLDLIGVGTDGELWDAKMSSGGIQRQGQSNARERSPLKAWLVRGATVSWFISGIEAPVLTRD
jgi:hypothetical protein